MEDNYNSEKEPLENKFEVENNLRQSEQPSVIKILLIAVGLFFLGQIVAGIVAIVASQISGIDWQILASKTKIENTLPNRSFLRFTIFWSQVLSFIVPAIIVLQYYYKKDWLTALGLNKFPNWKLVGLSILFLLVSVPVVQYSSELNKLIPLPAYLKSMESSTDEMLKAMLKKDFFYEIVINVILIGIIPAIGEELMFRGVLQQQIGRWIRNNHVMVWITAAIFSAIHFQFEGFLPRMVLGAVLGYLFVWTKNIWLPMLVHLFNNAAQVIAIYALGIKPEDADKIGSGKPMNWAFALASIFMMILLARVIQNEANKKPILMDER